MHTLPRMHQAVPQVRMLIQHVLPPAKVKPIRVLAFLQRRTNPGKGGLEHDLGGRAAEVKDGITRGIGRRRGSNGVQ